MSFFWPIMVKYSAKIPQKKRKKGKKFPDLNKDGIITKADILKGRGVKGMSKGGIVMKARGGGAATRGLNFVMPKD